MILFAAVVIGGANADASLAHADVLGMRSIASGGFGERENSYAWSMAWFNGALYVGTARSALCVERATIDYYYPGGDYYTTNPAPGVTCPPRIDDGDLRAEIWRYAPRSGRWTLVYRSPTVSDPRVRGRRVARDIGYRGMVVVTQRGGRTALYVGGLSPDEFIPGLARRSRPRILRSTDGIHFRALSGGPGVIQTWLGPRRPVGYRAMTVFHHQLYVTASAGLTGDGVVLRVDHPSGRRPAFTQVTPSRLAVFELQPFAGELYAGTGDSESGYGVWKASRPAASGWTPVVTDGAGRGSTVTSVVSMAPYRGDLYVGASGWGTSIFPVSELIRIAPDDRWDVVVGNSRTVGGAVKAPVSHLPDGFGNPFNSHFWRMVSYRGALLLGTNDWSWSLNGSPLATPSVRRQFGFDLYGTCNGDAWWRVTQNGVGHGDDFGMRTMTSSPAGLFLGTADVVRGTRILQSRATPCAARTRTYSAPLPIARRGRLVAGLARRRRSQFNSDFATGGSTVRPADAGRLQMMLGG